MGVVFFGGGMLKILGQYLKILLLCGNFIYVTQMQIKIIVLQIVSL